jgi:SAM-dependent methyltransferase
MDHKTIEYYDNHAEEVSLRYEKADVSKMRASTRYLKQGGTLLDIGCGTGRDAAKFQEEGFGVTAVDASAEMIGELHRLHPDIKNRCFQKALPFDETFVAKNKFDNISCIATLMHIDDLELFECAFQFKKMLNPCGRLLISVSINRPDLDQNDRDQLGRLFRERSAAEYQLLFERLGFSLISKEINSDGLDRSVLQWVTLVFGLDSSHLVRPADQIESIITRDSKNTTYKLALLRALCDISQSESNQAKWTHNDIVAIPLGLIAEKWLFYYWPIFESDILIPQQRGYEKNSQVAFRSYLTELICQYKPLGGMQRFFEDYRSCKVPPPCRDLVDKAINEIASTIIKGPVKYTGSSIDDDLPFFGKEGPFSASGKCHSARSSIGSLGRVLLKSDVWKEFCLIGHWIREALIIRWAELTREISQNNVAMTLILEKLLIRPDIERDQNTVRKIYSARGSISCVWSDKQLNNSFEVDHVIPFSLWFNNDLWNLLPADKKINLEKSNKIVTREILLKRRDPIIFYWEILKEALENRFEIELERCLLRESFHKETWQVKAFQGLAEAVEIVALQRGAKRWPSHASSEEINQSETVQNTVA